mgnify:CR=1 FL=1
MGLLELQRFRGIGNDFDFDVSFYGFTCPNKFLDIFAPIKKFVQLKTLLTG